MRLSCISIVLVLLSPAFVFSQTGKAVFMDWKFTEGEKFWVDTQIRIEQTERLGNQSAANIVLHRTITSYTVKKVTETNYIEFEAKIESTRYQNNQTPDSEKIATLFARMQGATFRLTMNPERQITKLEGYTEWLLKLASQLPPSEIDRLRALIPESDIRNAASEGFGFLPGKEVMLNQTWKKKSELNMAPAGVLNCTLNYTYRGPDKGREKIVIECKEPAQFTMTPALATPGTQSQFVLDSRTGTIWFNNQTGKLDQAEHTFQSHGTILIPATVNTGPLTLLVANKIQVKQALTSKPPSK